MMDIKFNESSEDSYNEEYLNGIKKSMLGELSRMIKDEYPFFLPNEKEFGKLLMESYQLYIIPWRMDELSVPQKISKNRRQLKQLKAQIQKPANLTNIKKIVFHIEGRTQKLVIDSEHSVVSIIAAIKKDKNLADYFDNVDLGIKKDGRVGDLTTGVIKRIASHLMKIINASDNNDFKSEAKKHTFIASFINIIREELNQDTISSKYIQKLILKG